MPYSGPEDESLPDRIKERPADERRAFVSAFNSAMERCMEDEGDEDECEGRAFAIATAAANRVRDAKVGRQLSSASRKKIQAAIEALTALLTQADDRESVLAQAAQALQDINLQDDLVNEYVLEPAKAIEILQSIEPKEKPMDDLFDLDASCAKKAIKIIDADDRRIGLYATVWGELDCDNERMTQKAIEPYVGQGNVPLMLWMHGLDEEFKTSIPGKWDADSFALDDLGLYTEGNIYKNATGNKAWERITHAGSYGGSVGSAWYLVRRQKSDDGYVDLIDWPLLEISIMEGGKQCVPSAHRNLRGKMRDLYAAKVAEFGIDWQEPGESGGDSAQIAYVLGGVKMSEQDVATVDLDVTIGEAVAAALAERDKVEREAKEAEERRQAEIQERAIKAAESIVDGKREEWEKELLERWEAEQKANKQKPVQPKAPPAVGDDRRVVIKMWSPYDRLDTFDLCLRYELMKSYGRRPSNKFWRALAARVIELADTEDTLYIHNGQSVKAPAIDWQVLVPKNLDIEEVDGELFGAKAGRLDRYFSGGGDLSEDNVTPQGIKQMMEIAIKANELVYSTQANAGDEWVPTLMTAQLWRTIRLQAAVLGLFEQFDMPSQPYDYPAESTDPVFYKVGESTNEAQLVLSGGPFTDSKPGTAKVTFSASKLGAISYWSEEMEEDAIVAVEPQFRDQYGTKMAHAIDEVLVSGDETTGTTNISYEGASITASSRFLCVDGLRHEALVTTTADSRDGGALTYDDFANTQALMGTGGKWGTNPADLVFISDTAVWHKAKMLGEVLTVDKFGSMATVLTGQLAAIFGSPYIVSEDYGLTDTTGRIDETAGDNTKGSFMCINKRGVLVGWRRRPRIRVVGLPGAEARYIVGSARFDIRYKEAGMVGLSYNLTV